MKNQQVLEELDAAVSVVLIYCRHRGMTVGLLRNAKDVTFAIFNGKRRVATLKGSTLARDLKRLLMEVFE